MKISEDGWLLAGNGIPAFERIKQVPGGWLVNESGATENWEYVPDPAYWIAQYVEATACKACKGAGVKSHSYLGSSSNTICSACNGKGR